MPDVASFAEIADDFNAVVSKVIWPSMTTIDRQGRPRTRIVHPIWEASTGWVMTSRTSLKVKHLQQQSPYVALCYVDLEGIDPAANQVYVECKAEVIATDVAEKSRVWDLFKSYPEPYGYEPSLFFQEGPAHEDFVVLKLTPWRMEIFALTAAMSGGPRVWRQDV